MRIIDFWLGIPADRAAPWADHATLGVEYLSADNWFFRVETYYKHFENLLTLNQGEQIIVDDDQVTTTPFNEFYDTRAYAYGLEFLFKKTAGRTRGWVGYTYAKTMKHIQKHGWYFPLYDRTHTLNIVGDITISLRNNVHLVLRYKHQAVNHLHHRLDGTIIGKHPTIPLCLIGMGMKIFSLGEKIRNDCPSISVWTLA